ncbi:MAG: hypothetical protein WAN51_03385 [Alphaproteobacteria bacterium]
MAGRAHGDAHYVLVGAPNAKEQVRFFIARNRAVAKHVRQPSAWPASGYMPLKAVEPYEDQWRTLLQ